jgi:hypothetical protein
MERLAKKREEARMTGAEVGAAAQLYGAETATALKKLRTEEALPQGTEKVGETRAATTPGAYLGSRR